MVHSLKEPTWMLLAGLASGKSASISRPAWGKGTSWCEVFETSFIWHTFGYFEKIHLILGHLLLGMLMFIAHSLLSKTSWLSESTVCINLHYCNPYKVLVHSADVAAAQGCSYDSFSMTLCTFKRRKRICTYLSHIYKDFIIIRDYVRLSRNLYIHYVRLSRNLYIHYVRLSTSLNKI